jgi:hypothetical protein
MSAGRRALVTGRADHTWSVEAQRPACLVADDVVVDASDAARLGERLERSAEATDDLVIGLVDDVPPDPFGEERPAPA